MVQVNLLQLEIALNFQNVSHITNPYQSKAHTKILLRSKVAVLPMNVMTKRKQVLTVSFAIKVIKEETFLNGDVQLMKKRAW